MTNQICYIVPSYSQNEASHMAHLPHFLSEVGKYCDVHVIIQRGRGQPEIPNVRSVYVQRPGNHFRRALELTRVAYRLWQQGCRKFFVRISASAALVLGLLGRILRFHVYYWVSGQGKDMKPPWRQGIRRRLYYELGDWMLRVNIRLAHRFVTGPESMLNYYVGEFGVNSAKIIVIYNDIDLATFRPVTTVNERQELRRYLALPSDKNVLLSVGRVSPWQNGPYVIPIAEQVGKRLCDTLFVVIGHIHMPEVVKYAQEKRLNHLRLLGALPNTEVLKYYQAADIFLMPSPVEGFPRKLLEAMACGLPIVAFDVGGIRDILGPKQQEFVVPRGDVEAFVSRTVDLIRQPELRQALAQENRQEVQRFSTERVAKMFVERIVWD